MPKKATRIHHKSRADVVAWSSTIDGRDVAREVSYQRKQHPAKNIKVFSGRHGSPGGGSLNSMAAGREAQRTFYREDRRGYGSVYDMGRSDHVARARRAERDPKNVVILGFCHGKDNKHFR
jgi:hypothetical protein